MEYNALYFRTTNRTCHCKLCDRVVERNTEKVIVFTTLRGHADTTHICLECIGNINKIIKED